MIHVPLLPEITHQNTRVTELAGVEHNTFLLLLSDCLIDADDSTQVVDVAEDENIVLEAGLLSDLRVEFIYVDFVIESMAHLY